MLDAERTGRWPRIGLVLSSRRWTRRLLRLRRCRILAFTRNPFLLVAMWFGHFIKHRRNTKGFRVFQKISKQTRDAFAWFRTSGVWRRHRGTAWCGKCPLDAASHQYAASQEGGRNRNAK